MNAAAHRTLRRYLPRELRLRVAVARRGVHDRRSGTRFATRRGTAEALPHRFAAYSRPFIDYPGQEQLAAAKRNNQQLMAARLDGVLLRPGETFSLWRLAGRPTASAGYLPAAAIIGGDLVTDVGGATCLLSTVVYNTALLGGMEIVERRCHSVDSYGEARYFELGRDAAIEYGYVDLRFRNPHAFPVVVAVRVDEHGVHAELRTASPPGFETIIAVSEPALTCTGSAHDTLRVWTSRTLLLGDGTQRHEELGESAYHVPWHTHSVHR